MAMPMKPTPERFCAHCGKRMERKRMSNGEIVSLLHFNRQKYCDRRCMVQAWLKRELPPTNARNGRARAQHRMSPGPCEVCGSQNAIDVHHRDKDTNNNRPENLQRICRSCHVRIHRKSKPCMVCGQPQKGLGYCEKHYQRFKKYGDPLLTKDNQFVPIRREDEANPKKTCSIPGCERPYHANGYCGMHAQRAKRGTLSA